MPCTLCIFPFNVQIPPIKLRLEDKSALKEENGIPNLAVTTVGTKEDCANRIVVLTVASCMMSLSDLPIQRANSTNQIAT